MNRRKLFGLAVVGTFFSGMGRALAVTHAGPPPTPYPQLLPMPPAVTFKFIVKMPPVYRAQSYTTDFGTRSEIAVLVGGPGCPPGMVSPYIGDTEPEGWKLFDNVADAFAYSYEIAARPPP